MAKPKYIEHFKYAVGDVVLFPRGKGVITAVGVVKGIRAELAKAYRIGRGEWWNEWQLQRMRSGA